MYNCLVMITHTMQAVLLGIIPGVPGYGELLIVLFLILLLFGGKKLPELARSLGKSMSEFKKGRQDGAKEVQLEQDAAKEESESSDAPKS